MERTEIAWAAGLFDGEGHIGLHRQKKGARIYFARQMGMTNTDLGLLERFQAAVESGYIGPPWDPPQPTHSRKWQWRLTGLHEIKRTFALLEPFLSSAKKEAGRLVILGRPPEDCHEY